MKAVAGSVLVLGANLLWGCAQIVGITTLDAGADDGGTGSSSGGSASGGGSGGGGSGSGGSGGSGSSSGGSSGSGSGGSSGGCTVPSGSACGVDPQCGCAAGQKCDIASAGAAACVAAGAGALGSRCTADTQCGAGLSCVAGVCHAYCNNAGGSCPGGLCVQVSGAEAQDQICSITCTLAPNTCGAGATCIPLGLANGNVTADCEAPGTLARGAACTDNTQCPAGEGCDGTSTGEECLPWCQLSPGTTPCAVGTCTAFNPAVVINGVTYGDCLP